MTKPRVRISNEALNSYWTRVITAGIDTSHFQQNPILLYMHERGEVIGTVENLAVEGDALVGDLVFDEVTDLSKRVALQFEKGSLRCVSAGLRIVELSDAPEMVVQGQTRSTVTRSILREVSVVDIPANPEAVRLYDQAGKLLELSEGGDSLLPKLTSLTPNSNSIIMELKAIALSLGLPETATEAEVQAKITELSSASSELKTLKEQNAQMTLAAITAAVETAIKEHRLAADKKEQFISLGQKIGLEELNSTLAAMQPAAKITSFIAPDAGEKGYAKLSDVPSDKLAELKEKDLAQYIKLYEAEYGFKPEL